MSTTLRFRENPGVDEEKRAHVASCPEEKALLHKPHRPRFVRLTAENCRAVLGVGVELEPWMVISNGRFVAKQRVTMIGPRGRIDGVAVVGPLVEVTQVSLAAYDEEKLGLADDPGRGVLLVGPGGEAKVVASE